MPARYDMTDDSRVLEVAPKINGVYYSRQESDSFRRREGGGLGRVWCVILLFLI